MSTAKNAILKAKIEGVLTEILVKTNAANVYVDENTTLAAKLAEIVASIATKASAEDMTTALAGKAEKVHQHVSADITDLDSKLAPLATTEAMTSAISTLRTELMGEGVPEVYDTFKEIEEYINEHGEVVEALNAAIGAKADKTAVEAIQATINGLGALANLDKVSEANLDDELKAKVNAAAEGNHSHANKDLLDTYTQTEADLADAVAKKHAHENKSVLDSITADNITAWNGKANVYYSSTEPANMTEKDLWVQIVE